MFNIKLLTLLSILIYLANSQDCAVPGHFCSDDAACCGGCCRNNQCIMMYESCHDYDDLCLSHYCPQDTECYIYQPDCEGCAPVASCRVQIKYVQ